MKKLYLLSLLTILLIFKGIAQEITCPNPVICGSNTNAVLTASTGNTYQWSFSANEFGTYTNLSGATSSTYTTTTLGFYKVLVNSVLSAAFKVSNTIIPTIICPNPILCGTNTSTTLTSSYIGPGFTYVWRKAGIIIPGATGPSITASEVGVGYYVSITSNGGCQYNSQPITLNYSGGGTLVNSNNTNDNVFMAPPQTTENLKINLTGNGPWEVGLNDGNTIRTYTANISPLIIPVSPTSPTNYSIKYVSSNCGVNTDGSRPTGNVTVGLAPAPTITFPTPSNLTVCIGNTIEVPYTVTGNLGNKLTVSVLIGEPTGGENRRVDTYIAITLDPLQTSGTIPIFIPNDLSLGSHGIYFATDVLKIGNPYGVWSNYVLNVVNNGCSATPTPTITGKANGCEKVVLNAMPFNGFGGSANTHQWYKDGVIMAGKTYYQLEVYESGNYTVQVINGTYNQTSAAKTVTINSIKPPISLTSAGNCVSILSTNFTNPSYTYNWYKEKSFPNGSIEKLPLFGENNSSISVTDLGNYSLKVWDGNCLNTSDNFTINSCPIISCSPDILVPVVAGTLSVSAVFTMPSSTGNSILQTTGLSSGSNFPFGTTLNSFKATNTIGITNTCSFKVIVYDQTAPTVQNSIIPNAIPDATTGNYSISSALFDVTIPSGVTVTGLLISAFPVGAASITINGINYGPPVSGAKLGNLKVVLVPFPVGGVIAVTDIAGKPIDPIVVNPLPTINQINIDYLAINSNNIQSPLPATLTVNFASAPLPVSLISFSGKNQENSIQLNWRISSETKFSHFEIQKSGEKKEFGLVGKVTGSKSGNYNFIDSNPEEGNNYYRLKMVDLDGKSSFSKTIAVNFEKNGYYLSVENPAKNGEFVVKSNYASPLFSIVNGLGNKVEMNISKMGENQYKLQTKNISTGIYFLMMESRGEVITRKVILE